MKHLIYKYALAVSFASIILKLIVFITDQQFTVIGEYSTYVIFLFILLAIYLGMRQARNITNNNQSLGENINVGCKIAAINGLVMGAFIYIYYSFIDTGYFTEKIRNTLVLMIQSDNYTIEQMKEYYINARLLFFAPDKVASFTLFGYLLLGCFYAVISGFVIRKKYASNMQLK
ncbi:MAG: DUF4199 domain-containing protein [Bacteroidota bacterium]|nr:DUF4199 domain-containing protein [Bacteroidota bacterium]